MFEEDIACRLLGVDANAVCRCNEGCKTSVSVHAWPCALCTEPARFVTEPQSLPLVIMALVWAGTLNCNQQKGGSVVQCVGVFSSEEASCSKTTPSPLLLRTLVLL